MAAVTICSDFGAQVNKVCRYFHIFPNLFARKWWDWMPWFEFSECWVSSQFFHSLSPSSRNSLVRLGSLPLGRCHLHICSYWHFLQQSWFQLELHPNTSRDVLCTQITWARWQHAALTPPFQLWACPLFHVQFQLLLHCSLVFDTFKVFKDFNFEICL